MAADNVAEDDFQEFGATALYDYKAECDSELSLVADTKYTIVKANESGQWLARHQDGSSGQAPSNYMRRSEIDEDKNKESSQSTDKELEDIDEQIHRLEEEQKEKICFACRNPINESFVLAKNRHFHVDCFKCSLCSQHLAGKGYVERDNTYFCEKCYHDKYSPKCAHCNEIIDGQYISALDQTQHPDHFVCTDCGSKFTSESFRKRNQKPYCESCYSKKFAVVCDKCGKQIKDKVFVAKDKNFHSECFTCDIDGKMIGESEPFHIRDNRIFCRDHYRSKYIHNCGRCGEEVQGKFVNVLDQYFHENCWNCFVCDVSLLDGNFKRTSEGKFVCLEHATASGKTSTGPSSPSPNQKESSSKARDSKTGTGVTAEEVTRQLESASLNEKGRKTDASQSAPPPFSNQPSTSGLSSPPPGSERLKNPSGQHYTIGNDSSYTNSQVEQSPHEISKFYPYDLLKDSERCPPDVLKVMKEKYLSDSEFYEVFKMSKADFKRLVHQKQMELKKKCGLF